MYRINYASGLTTYAPTFPVQVDPTEGADLVRFYFSTNDNSFKAELYILLRLTAPQLTAGYPTVSYSEYIHYSDWNDKSKTDYNELDMDIHSKGAWLAVTYKAQLVSESGLLIDPQILQPSDEGWANITVTTTNSGDAMVF